MKKYIKPEIEIVLTDVIVMDTDSTGHYSGGTALAKPNDPFFDWDDDAFGDLWSEEKDADI